MNEIKQNSIKSHNFINYDLNFKKEKASEMPRVLKLTKSLGKNLLSIASYGTSRKIARTGRAWSPAASANVFEPKIDEEDAPTPNQSTFKYAEMEYDIKKTKPILPDDVSKILFGKQFTDHMLTAEWTQQNGWARPLVGPFKHLEIHPAAKVLHYAIEIFEGMKAFKGVDGRVRLFRPNLNAIRMGKSANRIGLPPFDKEEFIKCLKKYVSIEKDWIPNSPLASLYLRPTFIGHDESLGVSSSNKALFFVIASPAGPYFPSGFKPVSLYADPRYVRAFPGGVGNFKFGSNYGPTIYVQMEAQKKGCQQVLWLFGEDNLISEAGTMNIFLVIKNKDQEIELVTPPLDGTILEGVTRQSILDLARKSGKIKVTERYISMKECVSLVENNRLIEMFGAGTACVVCPIERINFAGRDYEIPTMKSGGKYMSEYLKQLYDIQYGTVEHEWGVVVE